MNPRLLLAGLAVLLAGALAFLFFSDGPSGDVAAGRDGGAATELAGGAGVTDVDLAAAKEAATGPDGEEVKASKRREVRSEAEERAAAVDVKLGPVMKGRVVDDRGRGVPEATVELRLNLESEGLLGLMVEETLAKQKTTTNGLGYYELVGLPNKRVDFTVLAHGFERLQKSVVLPDDFTDPIADLEVAPGVVLHGTVVDLVGRAIEGAELFLVDPDRPDFGFRALTHPQPDAVSDVEGRFELAQVDVGRWAIEVRAFERPTRTFRGEAQTPGRISQGLWLEVPDGGTIKGIVKGLDPARYGEFRVEALPTEGMPYFGGRALDRPRAELDGDGAFELRGLDREVEYKVKLAPVSNGLVSFAGVTGTRSQEVTVRPLDVSIELDYVPGATIRFRAVDATDRKPVELYTARFGQMANARTLTNAAGEPLTDHRDGVGAFTDVYLGDAAMWDNDTWRLEIAAPGYEPFTLENVEFQDGVLRDLGDLMLQPSGRITVVVMDAVDGDPINSAIVRLTRLNERNGEESAMWRNLGLLTSPVKKTKTGSDGRATLDSFGSEPAELVVSRSRYADFVERVVLGADDRVIEVLLQLEATVEVLAQDAEGHELGEVEIEHTAPGDDEVTHTQRASTRGRVRFRGLEPGEHRFRIRPRGDAPESKWEKITVGPGTDATLVLIGPSRGEITGRVLEGGRPLAGASIGVTRADGSSQTRWQRNGRRGGRMVTGRNAETDKDGRYVVDDLEYGTYVVTVSHPDRAMSDRAEVVLDRASATCDVNLSTCAVEGVVHDEEGRPLAGVEVRAQREDGGEERIRFGGFGDWNDSSVVELGSVLAEPSGRTNANGEFRLRGLEAGVPIVLVASHPHAIDTSTDAFVLAPDQVRSGVEIEMTPAGSISVKVVTDGRVGWYEITATRDDGKGNTDSSSTWTMAGNTAKLDSLRPGEWTLEVHSRQDDERVLVGSRTVVVHSGEESEQVFDAP
ncbi:MAG: carboxypeptidase-like regulatory domain-containing protein [Planctomycetota bacterium]